MKRSLASCEPGRIRAAVVGCGWAGTIHAEALRACQEADLVALCDSDLRRAGLLGQRLGVQRLFSSFDEMLGAVELDTVVIATPPPFHAEQVRAAMDAGLPVLCEKPLTRDVAAARRLVQLAGERRLLLAVNYNRRFAAPYIQAREIVSMGRRVHFVTAVLFQSMPPHVSGPVIEDFLVWDAASHVFDIVRFVGGDVLEVYARLGRYGEGPWTDLSVSIQFLGGALGTVACSFVGGRLDSQHPIERVEVLTDLERIVCEDVVRSAIVYPHDRREALVYTPSIFEPRSYVDTIWSANHEWIRLVRETRAGATTSWGCLSTRLASGEDGLKALETCEAVLRSHAQGRPVEVSGM